MNNLNLQESYILLWIQNNLRNDALDTVMTFISSLNNSGEIAIFTVIVLLLWRKYRKVGITAMLSLATEFVIVNMILKVAVARYRPYVVNTLLNTLGEVPGDYSFPSGHTASVFAVATVLFSEMPRKFGIPAMIFAVLMGISRMYNAMHYPTDVLAGMVIGMATGVLFTRLMAGKELGNRRR